ncbi:MAG: MIP/aquaporin family protein [Pseudomonadota bacterium]
MSDFSLSRRLTAEAVGTCILVATVVGSGIMAERLADGNDAVALLGNTIATGAILVVLIMVFGAISGAHFNPAVTTCFRLRGDISTSDAAAYIVAQIIGGILGTLIAHIMFAESVITFSQTVRTGPGQWVGEFVATFGLVLTILACLKNRPEAIPYAVGLFITAGYWFTSSTSFANPAVAIARTLTDSFSGIRPIDAPAFIVMQIIGATVAVYFARWMYAERRSG